MDSSATATVRAFIAAINQGDAAQLSKLITEDHYFVESGRDRMIKGWDGYFRMFPGYRVEAECILEDGHLVAAFGSASGTYNGKRGLIPANRIEMPAAWKAVVKDGKVKLWQVYADWTEGSRIIDEDEQQG